MTNRFFKVLVGDFARRLEIPQHFLSHVPEINLRNSAKVVLKYSEGNTWIVELEKVDRCIFLTTGWPKFVKDNSLKEYEFIIFRYDNDMHFSISVFGWNACEKVIQFSGSGAQATAGGPEGKLSSDIFPSTKRGHSSDKLTRTTNSIMHSHSLVETPDQSDVKIVKFRRSTQGDNHISSQSFPDLHIHEIVGSQDELKTYLLSKASMKDDKTKSIAEVMRILHLDKVTINLLCAILCLYKWNVDAAAEDFNVCRGKPQIQNQFLKQKLVLQFEFLKRQLRHFFPPEEDCCTQIDDSKNCLEEPSLLNHPLQFDLTTLKRKEAPDHELHDSPCRRKKRIGSLRSRQTSEIPRRSPRLAHLKNGQTCGKKMERNAVQASKSFTRRGCIQSLPPTNPEVSACLRNNELYFTWKPSEQANPLEKILLNIQRNNFTRTISFVQGIIRNRPSDPLCAAVIDAVVHKEILKWNLCLEDMDAQKIVIALLEHAKKIKDMHNFDFEILKQEFSAKLQEQFMWQLKELETVHTSLQLDYKKATSDANIAVSILQEHKKKMHALQDDTKDLQQSLMKEDTMQNLVHQVAENENLVQKSLMERIRIKTVLKSYEHTLVEVKDWLVSNELGLIDIEALVKVEMDNMHKDTEVSKGSVLNIIFN